MPRRRARPDVLEGVADQVVQHVPQHRRVGPDRRQRADVDVRRRSAAAQVPRPAPATTSATSGAQRARRRARSGASRAVVYASSVSISAAIRSTALDDPVSAAAPRHLRPRSSAASSTAVSQCPRIDGQRRLQVVRHHAGEDRQVGLVPAQLGDVVEDRDRAVLPGARVERPAVDAEQDARPAGAGVADRPSRRRRTDSPRSARISGISSTGNGVRPSGRNSAVVLLPVVRGRPASSATPSSVLAAGLCSRNAPCSSTTPDPVADAGHDRAEQAGLAAALRLGGAQLGGGHLHLGAGPGPAGGQHVDQPGQDHGERSGRRPARSPGRSLRGAGQRARVGPR